MKTLLLVRHAKSDWGSLTQADIERPLNTRGIKNAHDMGSRLLKRKIEIDCIVASNAKRTTQTAHIIASEIHYPQEQIQFYNALYHAPQQCLLDTVLTLNSNWNTVMLVGHNNGITDFVNSFGFFVTDNMPTCSMACLSIACEHWYDFANAAKTLLFFDYPKRMDA
ncbi:MAG: histidine phosphatase family protein [Chitinophagaceae bacterium]